MVKVARRTPLDLATTASYARPFNLTKRPPAPSGNQYRSTNAPPGSSRVRRSGLPVLTPRLSQAASPIRGRGRLLLSTQLDPRAITARRCRAAPIAWTYARASACFGSSALVAPCTSVAVFPVGALVG
jgi:hypothetical protein